MTEAAPSGDGSRAEWLREDLARLMSADGQILGHVELRRWWSDGQREAVTAWVVAYLDPRETTQPIMVHSPLEVPAREATDQGRQDELVALALDAVQHPPPAPPPAASALEGLPSTLDRRGQLELLMLAWDRAYRELMRACALEEGESGDYERFMAVSDLLNRTYALDRTFNVVWQQLPIEVREAESVAADLRALRAIEHNARVSDQVSREYVPEDDGALKDHFLRRRNGKPYAHWSGPLLAGAFHRKFWEAVRWVRGQMTYNAAQSPIELLQWAAGVEPRWKWKQAGAITSERQALRNAGAYEAHLAGRDVLGVFSWLLEIFMEAERSLARLRAAEAGDTGS